MTELSVNDDKTLRMPTTKKKANVNPVRTANNTENTNISSTVGDDGTMRMDKILSNKTVTTRQASESNIEITTKENVRVILFGIVAE